MMFDNEARFKKGLAYDDVLLTPQYSEVLPDEVQVQSRLTNRILLKTPLISAAMDTITESSLAIAMAQEGGMGVIHKNMSIASQSREVSLVKRSQSGMVSNPITVEDTQSVQDALEIMREKGISGLPVVDKASHLVGIITDRDIRFEEDVGQEVGKVMTKDVMTANERTSSEEAIKILQKHRIEKLPVLHSQSKKLLGLFTFKDIEKSKKHPLSSKDSSGRLLVGAAIGASAESIERAESLLEAGCDVLVIDTAHGHSKGVIQTIKNVSDHFKKRYDFELIAGNIATPEAFDALVDAGADAVKVGVGPGSICTTRVVAGVGVPQFSAVLSCQKVSMKTGIPIIADGGIKYSGDLVKAFAAGASSVMMGNLFAGTDEAPGEFIIYQGKSYKSYRGMGSISAMAKGSKDRYGQGRVGDHRKLVPEGIEGRVAYKGPISNVIFQMTGGLRSAMGYLGAPTIQDLQEKATFNVMTSQGLKESHVHDVYITRESPNYHF